MESTVIRRKKRIDRYDGESDRTRRNLEPKLLE